MDNSPVIDVNQCKGYKAGAAILRGQIVKLSADDTVTPCTAAADLSMGVAYDRQPTSGLSVSIVQGGEAVVLTGGAITRGNFVTSDASGRAVVATPAAGGGTLKRVIGIAKETASASGQTLTIQVLPGIVETA